MGCGLVYADLWGVFRVRRQDVGATLVRNGAHLSRAGEGGPACCVFCCWAGPLFLWQELVITGMMDDVMLSASHAMDLPQVLHHLSSWQ